MEIIGSYKAYTCSILSRQQLTKRSVNWRQLILIWILEYWQKENKNQSFLLQCRVLFAWTLIFSLIKAQSIAIFLTVCPQISHNAASENLVLTQTIIPLLIFFFILITYQNGIKEKITSPRSLLLEVKGLIPKINISWAWVSKLDFKIYYMIVVKFNIHVAFILFLFRFVWRAIMDDDGDAISSPPPPAPAPTPSSPVETPQPVERAVTPEPPRETDEGQSKVEQPSKLKDERPEGTKTPPGGSQER